MLVVLQIVILFFLFDLIGKNTKGYQKLLCVSDFNNLGIR